MDHYTIFISDLHLNNTTPETIRLLLKFMAGIPKEAEALYILGDLFKFWVGDDVRSVCSEQIKKALQQASKRIPIYLMPGNRDFLLGETFAKESGCILISDPYVINLYGRKTVLTHGDILCAKDTKYRIFRKIIRIPSGIKIFLKMPQAIRLWLASNMQKYSAYIKKSQSKELLAAQTKEAENLLNKFASEQIIHGHTHIAEVEEFMVAINKARRISLGEWDQHGSSILHYYANHKIEFEPTINVSNF